MPESNTANVTRFASAADTTSRNLAALGELHGVGKQILEDLPEPLRIGDDASR